MYFRHDVIIPHSQFEELPKILDSVHAPDHTFPRGLGQEYVDTLLLNGYIQVNMDIATL